MKCCVLVFLALVGPLALAKRHKATASASKVHMNKVGSCQVKDPVKMVSILKQWHLPPKTATRGFKEKYAQEKNQTAIYQYLEEGVKRKDLNLIVSEGCEGPINSEFKPTFNGWDYASLKSQSRQKGYDKIITLAPLKIVAKYDDKVETVCGDSEVLIQEGNLRLSNLRGWTGFYFRINEASGDKDKSQSYADSAADLLKVPRTLPREQLMTQIKDKIKVELEALRKSLSDRDDAFVKVVQNHDFTKAAVVIGGLHADDLKEKLEKAGIGCEVLEPPGYQREDENLIQDFQRALQ